MGWMMTKLWPIIIVMLVALWPSDALACGIAPTGRAPSLELERVLIIHDAAEGRQHFIREMAFKDATASFGFIVPTPSLPAVGEVDGKLMERMALSFSNDPRRGSGQGFGSGGSSRVRVIDKKIIGRFLSVVVKADDERALAAWLRKHGFNRSPALDSWLTHYVRAGFHFVAMRYMPPNKPRSARVETTTVSISFDTPIPFYPYLEPTGQGATSQRRAMQLWVVADAPLFPVALHDPVDPRKKMRWVRPLKRTAVVPLDEQAQAASKPQPPPKPKPEPAPKPKPKPSKGDPLSARGNMWGDSIGESFGAGGLGLSGIGEGRPTEIGIGMGSLGNIGTMDVRANLSQALGPKLTKLLPETPLYILMFHDQKRDRSGYGDILFLPEAPAKADSGKMKRMLSLLDPRSYRQH